MATSDVKLLGARPSQYVNRVQVALNMKSVEYEFVEEDFSSKSELLLKSNPIHQKVPVLIHGDKPVNESLIIVHYIDEVWETSGPSILPSDPYDRVIARFWASYLDDKWFPSVRQIRLAQEEEAKYTAVERVMEGLALMEEAFVKCSKGKGFFGGDNIGYLDIALGCHLGWLRVSEKMGNVKLLEEAKTPHLAAWAARFLSHDAVKDVILDTKKLVEVAKVFMARAKAASQK